MMRIRSFSVFTNLLDEEAAAAHPTGATVTSCCDSTQTEVPPAETAPERGEADTFLPAA